MAQYNEQILPDIEKVKSDRVAAQGKLDKVKKIIEDFDKKIDEAKAAGSEQREKREGVKEEADKINAVIEKQNEEITAIFDEKDKCRENYFK